MSLGQVERARQFGDLQSLMCDQGFVVGGLGLGHRQLGFNLRCPGTFGNQRRLQRSEVVGEILGRRRHGPDYPTMPRPELLNRKVSQSAAAPDRVAAGFQPATSGRQVRTGFLQSIPSSM